MKQHDDHLVPTTVLLPKKLKDRAKLVAPEYGAFSKMICDGLEQQVEIRERLQQQSQEQKAS
jgi:hypothetical protein